MTLYQAELYIPLALEPHKGLTATWQNSVPETVGAPMGSSDSEDDHGVCG